MQAPVQDQPDHQARVQRRQPPQHQPMLLYPFSCECVPETLRKQSIIIILRLIVPNVNDELTSNVMACWLFGSICRNALQNFIAVEYSLMRALPMAK